MHEVLTRARGGDPTDKSNILCLCRQCHQWVTTHETAARGLGLVRARSAEEHQQAFRPWTSISTQQQLG
ncbi:HNH endonuclease [Arthrobacter phage Ottawa]|nr:HNH endonuclease [Arthrobacter phage Kharcho]WIC89290.1 HNH endonuclease [Arthrobacter phage Ottawa]